MSDDSDWGELPVPTRVVGPNFSSSKKGTEHNEKNKRSTFPTGAMNTGFRSLLQARGGGDPPRRRQAPNKQQNQGFAGKPPARNTTPFGGFGGQYGRSKSKFADAARWRAPTFNDPVAAEIAANGYGRVSKVSSMLSTESWGSKEEFVTPPLGDAQKGFGEESPPATTNDDSKSSPIPAALMGYGQHLLMSCASDDDIPLPVNANRQLFPNSLERTSDTKPKIPAARTEKKQPADAQHGILKVSKEALKFTTAVLSSSSSDSFSTFVEEDKKEQHVHWGAAGDGAKVKANLVRLESSQGSFGNTRDEYSAPNGAAPGAAPIVMMRSVNTQTMCPQHWVAYGVPAPREHRYTKLRPTKEKRQVGRFEVSTQVEMGKEEAEGKTKKETAEKVVQQQKKMETLVNQEHVVKKEPAPVVEEQQIVQQQKEETQANKAENGQRKVARAAGGDAFSTSTESQDGSSVIGNREGQLDQELKRQLAEQQQMERNANERRNFEQQTVKEQQQYIGNSSEIEVHSVDDGARDAAAALPFALPKKTCSALSVRLDNANCTRGARVADAHTQTDDLYSVAIFASCGRVDDDREDLLRRLKEEHEKVVQLTQHLLGERMKNSILQFEVSSLGDVGVEILNRAGMLPNGRVHEYAKQEMDEA